MNDRIGALAAQHRRIEAKKVALIKRARALDAELNRAFGGADIAGVSSNVTLEQIGYDEHAYGYLCYRDGELTVGYRTTDDDLADGHHGVPDEQRSYSVRQLANCSPEWLERLLDEAPLESLLGNIAARLCEREGRLDGSLSALQTILAAESAKLDGQMVDRLDKTGDDTLQRLFDEAVDVAHLDTADGLTRSSRFLEAVCATILRERGLPLPDNQSLGPLVNACIDGLELSAEKKALDDVRQFIGGVKSLCNGVGSLRTHFGTAHGASSHLPPLDASWAMLAKNAAAAVAIFLLSRHRDGTDATPRDATVEDTP
ncbi:abortive infection family protein [Paraburkholderia aromaticivorans]|uniref:abortive infection family protein n=1 Tax=Paraburkholderia aromaticivorans TaxID=2026199 RepID=UPI00145602EE|nr:abortive infection family protein [Paraburkholderia aromaticivorans]